MRVTPIWTGLMSPSSTSRITIGMKMMIAGTASTKSPTMMNSRTSRNMIMRGSVPAVLCDPVGDRVRAAQVGEHPAEGRGAGDRGHRDGVQQPRVHEVARQVRDVVGPKRRNDHHHDVGDGSESRLGRREPAGQDAAHDDHRDHQRQRGAAGRDRELAHGGAAPHDAGRPEHDSCRSSGRCRSARPAPRRRETGRRSRRCRWRRRPPP